MARRSTRERLEACREKQRRLDEEFRAKAARAADAHAYRMRMLFLEDSRLVKQLNREKAHKAGSRSEDG